MRSLLLLGLLTTTGCAMNQTLASSNASADLRTLVEDFYEQYLRLHPTEATLIGDSRFDDQLGNPASPQHHAALTSLYERSLKQVRTIDPSSLPESDRITLEVFIWNCEQALALRKFPIHLLPLNQMDSLASTLAQFGSGEGAQPLATFAQHQAWLKRAAQFPAWVDAAIAQLRQGQQQGVTHPKAAMEELVSQLDTLANPDPETSLFFLPLKKASHIAPAPTDGELAALAQQYREVMSGQVIPAYAKLRDFIRDEHLPACRETVGWSALPQGKEWYLRHVQRLTTTDLSPEEIHQQGLVEVARIRKEMEEVKNKVGFNGELPAFFAHVRDDERFFFKSPKELLDGYLDLKTRIDAALPRLFSDFPRANYEVREVEAYRAQSAAGAEYQAPSEDGSRPGIFYVNTFNLKAQPRYGMETLSLHEAAPGHHFQIAIQQELSHLPRFRRFGDYVAYAEGWALYAESLGPELGLFQDPMQYYGRLNDEQLRAMRLVVDTGLHAMGWSREQAIQFMLDNSSLAKSDVVAEVERYMVWPGQALGYKVGQLRLTALRKKAEAELGDRFDLKAWHSAVLREGSMPLAVLEARLDRWVAARK